MVHGARTPCPAARLPQPEDYLSSPLDRPVGRPLGCLERAEGAGKVGESALLCVRGEMASGKGKGPKESGTSSLG